MANLPKIALGAWAWGNDGTFGNDITADSLKPIFDTAMANGLNLWDTAYAYGMGISEKVLHHIKGAVKAADLVLSQEEILWLEEPYVPHPLAGVMAQNKPAAAKEKHVWSTGDQKIIK